MIDGTSFGQLADHQDHLKAFETVAQRYEVPDTEMVGELERLAAAICGEGRTALGVIELLHRGTQLLSDAPECCDRFLAGWQGDVGAVEGWWVILTGNRAESLPAGPLAQGDRHA